jgi:pilus assembly protein CpaE
MISQLTAEYPQLPILTISSDAQLLLQSLQRGARNFLTQPIDLESLLQALKKTLGGGGVGGSGQHAVAGAGGRPLPTSQGTVLAVLGSRGGIGCTSVAVNLAATLASDPNNQVALLDLDLALGDADIALEVQGADNITIADLARNIERLDMNFLRRAMVRHASGVSVLRHPLELSEAVGIHDLHVERIINLLKISYSHLVLDLSKALLPTDVMALRLADMILLVAQLELSSLRNVVRMVHTLSNEENFGEKIRLVMNRVGSEFIEDGISLKKAEEVVGRPIFWQIPNDTKAMVGARVAGVPLIKHAPRCRAQQSIGGLVQVLCGRTAPPPSAEPRKRSGWFG